MRFLTEENDNHPSVFDEGCMERRMFEFCPSKEDYFLTFHAGWTHARGPIYHFVIGKQIFFIPSGIYMCVACETGAIDWMQSDEVVGKTMSCLTMRPDFKGWRFTDIEIAGQSFNDYYIPMSKNPYPVLDAYSQRMILVASVDQYHKFKNKEYEIFFLT